MGNLCVVICELIDGGREGHCVPREIQYVDNLFLQTNLVIFFYFPLSGRNYF